MTDLPEQPLWDWLDAASVPFRETAGRLVDRYGLTERPAATWTESVCPLPQVPAGLATSGLWTRPPAAGPPAPPPLFWATWTGRAVRQSTFRSVLRALSDVLGTAETETTPRFGGGQEMRVRWRHGAAGVDLVCLTEGRLQDVFGGAGSLYATVVTAVVPDLSGDEADVVARSRRLDPGVPIYDIGTGSGDVPGLWRRNALGLPPGDLRIDDATRTLTFATTDRLVYVSPEWVTRVRLQNVPVGKAGDASFVALMHGESRLASLWGAARAHALDDAAAALAERLDVPLATEMLPAG